MLDQRPGLTESMWKAGDGPRETLCTVRPGFGEAPLRELLREAATGRLHGHGQRATVRPRSVGSVAMPSGPGWSCPDSAGCYMLCHNVRGRGRPVRTVESQADKVERTPLTVRHRTLTRIRKSAWSSLGCPKHWLIQNASLTMPAPEGRRWPPRRQGRYRGGQNTCGFIERPWMSTSTRSGRALEQKRRVIRHGCLAPS